MRRSTKSGLSQLVTSLLGSNSRCMNGFVFVQPVLVSGIHKRLNASLWKADSFNQEFADHQGDLLNCKDQVVSNSGIKEFWDGFEDITSESASYFLFSQLLMCSLCCIVSSRSIQFDINLLPERPKSKDGEPMVYRLKDWPSGEEFMALMPSRSGLFFSQWYKANFRMITAFHGSCKSLNSDEKQSCPCFSRYDDLMKNLPLPEYSDPEGNLNLASYLPPFFVRPDLGPRLSCAYGKGISFHYLFCIVFQLATVTVIRAQASTPLHGRAEMAPQRTRFDLEA